MMLLTTVIAITATAEAIIIITLCGVIRLSIRENVKLVRGVARSKNQSAFAEVYSNIDRPHKRHVSLAAQQEKSMQSGGDD